MTHQYLRYTSGPVFGVLASAEARVAFVRYQNAASRYYAVTACENVILWDSKTKQKVKEFRGQKHSTTCLATSPDHRHLAVGYADGAVRIFDVEQPSGEAAITFQGHKAAVTSLDFDEGRLASAGKDSVIILWDVVGEAGMFRLKGHKGVVTRCRFMRQRKNVLVSSSKDTFVKFWDLDTQHCFKTLVGHRGEVWDFVLVRQDTWLVTGSADSELRVWEIADKKEQSSESAADVKKTRADAVEGDEEEAEDEVGCPLSCTKFGSVMRQGRGRVCSLVVDPAERAILCHGVDSVVEVFSLNDEAKMKGKLQKRARKLRKRQLKSASTEDQPEDQPEDHLQVSLTIADTVERLQSFKCSSKPCCLDVFSVKQGLAKVAVGLKNNQVEFYAISVADKTVAPVLADSIQQAGHRSDVRALSFSSDNTAVLSVSGETVKVWGRTSQQCLRSMECDYGLCCSFLPGDRHCIVGTKTGKLQLFDIGAKSVVEDIAAHTGPVWSLDLYQDKRGLVSGSGDKTVKFWDFDLVDRDGGAKVLALVHTRTLQLDEDVLCVRVTPNGKLLAVSLMDSTVKVFFMDTLKFFLSMYGHKFPALCMDVSYDSTLLASGSADRTVKIWGLDFGDCHRSILAHDDSVMCLQFLPKTHMFFTGSKDATVKQWDADNFQKIVTLEGHQAEIWALAISPDGRHMATASHDRSLRLWHKTDEPLVLEEERENEREAEFEAGTSLEEAVIPREGGKDEVGLAAKKTTETVKIAERLLEAIDVYREQRANLQEYEAVRKVRTAEPVPPPPAPHPLMTVYQTSCPDRYMLETLRRIRYSELEETLLVLPFGYVVDLLKVLAELLSRNWEVELCCRCLFFLLRVHSGQIGATAALVPVVDRLRLCTLAHLGQARDEVGFNLAGLNFLQREIDAREEVALFTDATRAFKERKKRKSKKERAILSIVAS